MNETIQKLVGHTSIRRYLQKEVPQNMIDAILQAVQQAPSWINGQQLSIIRVTDADKRQQLQQLAGDQVYVGQAPEFWVFCLDFYRVSKALALEGKTFQAADNPDLIIVGASDVGISLGTAVAAAESLGLGTVAIGGVRRDPQAVIDVLELPAYVYPISGLCIGFPDEAPDVKPRLPRQAIVFENTYNTEVDEMLEAYNETISAYMHKRTGGQAKTNWSSGVASFYSEPFYRGNSYANATPILKKQGFLKK